MKTTSALRPLAAVALLSLVQSVVTATEPETAKIEKVTRAAKPPLTFAEWSAEKSKGAFTVPASPAGEPKVVLHVACDPLWPNGYKTVEEAVARLAESGLRPATREEFARFRVANPNVLERVFQDERIEWGGYGVILCLDLQAPPKNLDGNFTGRLLPAIYVDPQDGRQVSATAPLAERTATGPLPSLEVHVDTVRTAILVTRSIPAALAVAPSPEP